MKARVSRPSTLVLFATAFAAPAFGQSVLLRLNPDEGLVSEYVMSMEMNMDMPMMSSDKPFMTATTYTTQTVVGVEGEVVEYRMVTDSATLETPAMPMAQGQIPDMTGSTQTMKMDTRGRIVDMQVEDAPPEVQEAVGQFGGGGMNMELPEEKVSPGDTWTDSIDFGAPGMPGGGEMSMQMETTYTLTEVSTVGGTQFATIAFEGPIVMSGEGGGMGMDASGSASGTLVLDIANGRMASTDMSMSLDMNAGGMAISTIMSMNNRLIN